MAGLPSELFYTPDQVKPIEDGYRMDLIKNANLSKPLKNGWNLYPHQKKAIIRSLTMRRMILALDMGLGKTIIGAVWASAFKRTFEKLKIFVICPVTLKEEWKRTAEERVGLRVEPEEKVKTSRPSKKGKAKRDVEEEGSDACIDDGLGLKICSWAKVPSDVEPNVKHFVVCCDEAHSMQSAQAQRTKGVLTLVEDKRYACRSLRLPTLVCSSDEKGV
jgi:SNF2 family DNA or RNA helicase